MELEAKKLTMVAVSYPNKTSGNALFCLPRCLGMGAGSTGKLQHDLGTFGQMTLNCQQCAAHANVQGRGKFNELFAVRV